MVRHQAAQNQINTRKQRDMTELAQAQGPGAIPEDAAKQDHKLAQLIYILQAVGLFVGLTFIAAMIVNTIKRDDLKTDVGRSHFRWQLRTFWFSVLWIAVGTLTSVFIVGYFILLADVIWVIYRIVKGWLRLNDGKAMYEK